MSKYLLDSNIFITPHRSYYSFDFANSFWEQLANILRSKKATILKVVSDEILKDGEDRLAKWLKNLKKDIKVLSVSRNQKIHDNYARVLQYVQTCGNYKDNAILNWAKEDIADPWLIATAMSDDDYKIVTDEQSAGGFSKKNPHNNAKIPDVANYFGVKCITLFDFMRAMNFKL